MSENNLNINSNSGGSILNRTSYDVRQEINTNVIGVLKYNNEIRKKLLNRNIGKYNMINLNEGIGYIPNFYFNESSKPLSLGEDGLLGHTHLYRSDYQNNINKKYNIGDYIQYYQHGSLPDYDSLKWNGNYENYVDYVNGILNLSLTPNQVFLDLFKTDKLKNENYSYEESQTIQTVINDFIQFDNIKYAMETTRVGIVNPNPLAALSGATTTNISNFSATDTKLGLITNKLYAHSLRKGAQFNTIRKTPYITPEIYETIGNKLVTLSTLDSEYRFDDKTGRIIDFDSVKTNDVIGDASDSIDFDIVLNDINSLNIGSKSKNYLIDNLKRNTYSYNNNETYEITTTVGRGRKKETKKETIEQVVTKYALKNYFNLTDILKSINNTGWDELDNELPSDIPKDSIIYKTKELFNNKKINTLVSRFFDDKNKENNILQSAVNNIYGVSRGRNLLSIKYTDNSKVNPYCRVWTKNHQYDNISKLISSKPKNESENLIERFGRRAGSVERLKSNSVRNNNGFINITPQYDGEKYNIKKCMFSIENLAWKGVANEFNLSDEQIGPNKGRIMWFPPYNLSFNENISTNWNGNDFIGRGEKIYTYVNTERSGTLSFDLLVDYPSILDIWKKNGENLTKDSEKDEQTLLRFFAGDENLRLRDFAKEEKDLENEILKQSNLITEINRDGYVQEKEFTLYFPRYYSGIDDKVAKNTIGYLMNNYETNNAPENDYELPPYIDDEYMEPENWQEKFTDNFYGKTKYKADKEFYYTKKGLFLMFNETNEMLNQDFYDNCLDFLLDIENNRDKYKIKKIEITGRECPEDEWYENKIEPVLSNNRCNIVKHFIKEKIDISDNIIIINPITSDKIGKNFWGPYTKQYKHNRSVTIKICYTNQLDDKNKISELMTDIIGLNAKKGILKNSKVKTAYGWDCEGQYFEMLKDNDLFTYNKIIDKIKYFTPAFHSITPEGFNARLSFLHQCTRQGQTLNSSDNENLMSAGNLSFGRPPICVLRIGDFFNTKIVITSITISYDNSGGIQWDLNQEGIGIQPMMARISLNFNFLGGSDISGPISRLQNAVSFNYYANQSIYDDRADIDINKDIWVPK